MNPQITFVGIFGYRQYLQFLSFLDEVPVGSVLDVDLGEVRFAHPSGMAPFVATIQRLSVEGWQFEVSLPGDAFLADYFEKAGWVAGITGREPPPIVPGRSYVPLTSYESHEELNPLVSSLIEHLATSSVFEAGVLDAIGWSLNEVADNVLLHAGPGVPGWIQLTELPKKRRVEIVVADCGQGISASLRDALPDLVDDREALMKAIEKGVTRDPKVGQGNGLAGTVRIAAAADGWANLHSGSGILRLLQGQPAPFCEIGPAHQGTVVELTLPTDRPIDVADALWGYEPLHEFELEYLQDDGDGLILTLTNEATGFGNRASAKPVRTKIRNLMNQFPNEEIVVDFGGVTLISASFADELVARLVVEVGPATFLTRVRLVNLSDLARRTIDAVVAQRLASS